MPFKKTSSVILLVVFFCTSTACTTRQTSSNTIKTTIETAEITGWFDSIGEWSIFPNRDRSKYNPYTENDDERCVSIINDTGKPRSDFNSLDRSHVRAIGYTIDYFDLMIGSHISDQFLSLRYFDNQPVHNACVRDFVFVAKKITREKPHKQQPPDEAL